MTTAAELREQTILAWPEKQFQEQVIILARFLGWELIYHTHRSDRSPAGFPDLVLVHPGQRRVIWRELKATKGRLSPAQRIWLDGLGIAGQDAAVWRPTDFLSGLIEKELRA